LAGAWWHSSTTIGLGNVFDSVAYEYPIRRGIQEGYLCDIVQRAVYCADLDLSDIRTLGGDLAQGELEAALTIDGVLHQVAAPLVEQAGNRQTLIFTAGVQQAHALADVIAGYLDDTSKVAALDGTTPRKERARLISGFRSGAIQYLVNCAVLTEGFDAPECACIAIARPTKSRALYTQMVGRGTRTADGKIDCLILDFVGNSGRHKLVTPLDVLAGKPIPPDVERETLGLIAEGKPTEQALREAEERAIERVRAEAERRARAAKIRADVAYQTRIVDPFELFGVEPYGLGEPASGQTIGLSRKPRRHDQGPRLDQNRGEPHDRPAPETPTAGTLPLQTGTNPGQERIADRGHFCRSLAMDRCHRQEPMALPRMASTRGVERPSGVNLEHAELMAAKTQWPLDAISRLHFGSERYAATR
jgi:hypothetical protein